MTAQIEKTRTDNTSYHSYQEADHFEISGRPIFSVLDFWKYCYGDLASQSPAIAEFLVAKALHIEKAENMTYWTAYDMSYRGVRIEVKATEYVHSWNKTRVSKVRTFSIAPSNNRYWGNTGDRKLSRQNDIYVFCINTNQEVQKPQPLNIDYWKFYVLETRRINQYTEINGNPNQKKISLNVIKQMAGVPVNWSDLRNKVDQIVDERAIEQPNPEGETSSSD